MSQDTAPRHRYAVTFSVVVMVEAETEDKAIEYAEEKLDDGAIRPGCLPERGIWPTLENVAREDA